MPAQSNHLGSSAFPKRNGPYSSPGTGCPASWTAPPEGAGVGARGGCHARVRVSFLAPSHSPSDMGLPRSTLRWALARGLPRRKIRFVRRVKEIDSSPPNSSPGTHAPAALGLRRIPAARPAGRPWRPNGRKKSRVSMSRKSRVSARPQTRPPTGAASAPPAQPSTAGAIPDAPFHVVEVSSPSPPPPSGSREISSDVLKTPRGSTQNTRKPTHNRPNSHAGPFARRSAGHMRPAAGFDNPTYPSDFFAAGFGRLPGAGEV